MTPFLMRSSRKAIAACRARSAACSMLQPSLAYLWTSNALPRVILLSRNSTRQLLYRSSQTMLGAPLCLPSPCLVVLVLDGCVREAEPCLRLVTGGSGGPFSHTSVGIGATGLVITGISTAALFRLAGGSSEASCGLSCARGTPLLEPLPLSSSRGAASEPTTCALCERIMGLCGIGCRRLACDCNLRLDLRSIASCCAWPSICIGSSKD